MSARDELAELIAKAIEDTYHGFASACGDEVTISVTMQGEDSVSVDCDKVADAILAAGWIKRHRALPICAPFDHIMYVSCAICGETPEDAAYDRP